MTQAPPGRDPWEGYDEAAYAADALYCGPHEVIPNLMLLTDVCLNFEAWAENFRQRDRRTSSMPDWYQESIYSETTSIRMAATEVGRDPR